jgi:TPR repeat protein
LFEAAAKEGHPMSQYVLGVMHVRGIGVVQDGDKALEWLGKASKADLAIAHYALGVVYRDSTPGLNPVRPDKAKAAIHFARAQSLGYRQAGEALRQLEFEKPRSIE